MKPYWDLAALAAFWLGVLVIGAYIVKVLGW